MQLPVIGYGLRYEYGMFTQTIVNGEQVEKPDHWLRHGNVWEIERLEYSHCIKFGGHIETQIDENGEQRHSVIDEIVNGYQQDSTGKLINTTYHHDALESVLGQRGHDGSILATQSYSAFGSILSQTGSSNNAQKYTGREIDSETGFYYYRARYYDPIIGRFISEDPKGFGAGVNFYVYCGNNPINCSDPSGEIPLPLATGIIGFGAGALGSATGQVISNGGFNNFSWPNVGLELS